MCFLYWKKSFHFWPLRLSYGIRYSFLVSASLIVRSLAVFFCRLLFYEQVFLREERWFLCLAYQVFGLIWKDYCSKGYFDGTCLSRVWEWSVSQRGPFWCAIKWGCYGIRKVFFFYLFYQGWLKARGSDWQSWAGVS